MNTVVHIGYHKTGTTSLQRGFFSQLTDCTLVTHGGRDSRSVFRVLADNLMLADDNEFLESTLRSYFAELDARSAGPLIVSHEGFSGQVFEGSFNRIRNADRLQRVVPGAKILIVVRHQADFLRSLYSQHIRHGGFETFSNFITTRRAGADQLDLEHLQFDLLVAEYQSRFGDDRVKVLAFEQLKADPAAFGAILCRYVGSAIPVADLPRIGHRGQSLSRLSRWILRRTNRAFWNTRINPDPTLLSWKRAVRLSDFLHERIDARLFKRSSRALPAADERLLQALANECGPSNRRLAALTGLPLEDLGYPMGSE